MISFRRIEMKLTRREEQQRKRRTKKYCIRYPHKKNIIFLKRVISRSYFHWKLIHSVNYEDYIWWSYGNFTRNDKFEIFCLNVQLQNDIGLPKCIIKIVELINKNTYLINK